MEQSGINFEAIRLQRERVGLTQTEAAKKGRMALSQWANMEAARRPNMSAAMLQRVAWVIGAPSMDSLMFPLNLSAPERTAAVHKARIRKARDKA